MYYIADNTVCLQAFFKQEDLSLQHFFVKPAGLRRMPQTSPLYNQ